MFTNKILIDHFNPHMENLIREKENILNEIVKLKNLYDDYKNSEFEINKNLENLNKQYLVTIEKYESIKTILKQKKKSFEDLKLKIKYYKQTKYEEVKQIYEKQYENLLLKINSIKINYNMQIFESFAQFLEISRDIKFRNLKNFFTIYFNDIKNHLKNKLIKDLSHQNQIHRIILKLKFIIKYEEYFKEKIIYECLNKYINIRYEYHFLSNKETNRLDKADWIFAWLQNKIDETYKIIKVYNSLKKVEEFEKINFLMIEDVIKNVNLLIYKKIEEIQSIDSTQKREISINFNYHLMIYINYINTEYNIQIYNKFLDFKNEIICQEKKLFIEKLKNIHLENFKVWFDSYEEIFKECINLNKKKLAINGNIILKYIIDYNMVFINNMRYINRDEIEVLIFLFNKFENLKEFCVIENVKFRDYSECKINDFFNDDFIFEITKFNLANFKLIKSLFENDIKNILNIKYYFVNDVAIILDEYKTCLGFSKLKSLASKMIDNYFLNDILLKNILNKDEFLNLMSIFRELKNNFEIKEWKSRECLKCIKGFYEGKKIKNEYYNLIRKMYN